MLKGKYGQLRLEGWQIAHVALAQQLVIALNIHAVSWLSGLAAQRLEVVPIMSYEGENFTAVRAVVEDSPSSSVFTGSAYLDVSSVSLFSVFLSLSMSLSIS